MHIYNRVFGDGEYKTVCCRWEFLWGRIAARMTIDYIQPEFPVLVDSAGINPPVGESV